MKPGISMKAFAIASFVVLAAGALEQRAVAAEDTYRVRELRDTTNRAGVGTVIVTQLNNMSEIIGRSTDANGALQPTFWHHFFPTNLYTAYNQQINSVDGLNDRSELVGTTNSGIYILRRGQLELPTANGDRLLGSSVVLNNRGEIAYSWQTTDINIEGFYWFNGFVTGTGGTDAFNFPAAINSAGRVLGNSSYDTRYGPQDPPDAWIFSGASQPFVVIPPLPGDTGVGASDINDHNEVVGTSSTQDENGSFLRGRAYLWKDGVASDLHMTLPGDVNCVAAALNDSTVIVGWSSPNVGFDPNSGKAVIWRDGTTRDLTTLIDANDPLKRYVRLTIAKDINDTGEIIAQGVDTRTGKSRAYFLRPMRLPNINP